MSYNEAAMEWGWFLHLSVGSHHLCHCGSLPGRHHTHPRACLRKRWGQRSELEQNPVVQLKHELENQHIAGSNILMSTMCCAWVLFGMEGIVLPPALRHIWAQGSGAEQSWAAKPQTVNSLANGCLLFLSRINESLARQNESPGGWCVG